MVGRIDLHCHTTASDGEMSPKQIVDCALKKNIKALAITDHDSIDSIKIVLENLREKFLRRNNYVF